MSTSYYQVDILALLQNLKLGEIVWLDEMIYLGSMDGDSFRQSKRNNTQNLERFGLTICQI
jgi:hypothetical protein